MVSCPETPSVTSGLIDGRTLATCTAAVAQYRREQRSIGERRLARDWADTRAPITQLRDTVLQPAETPNTGANRKITILRASQFVDQRISNRRRRACRMSARGSRRAKNVVVGADSRGTSPLPGRTGRGRTHRAIFQAQKGQVRREGHTGNKISNRTLSTLQPVQNARCHTLR
jgi:hypothetical protein